MSLFLLLCAVMVSLAAGVLIAQGLCALMFAVFRIRATQVGAVPTAAKPLGAAAEMKTLQS